MNRQIDAAQPHVWAPAVARQHGGWMSPNALQARYCFVGARGAGTMMCAYGVPFHIT